MKVCDFTKPELDKLRQDCNFTDEEMEFFNCRANGLTIFEIAEKLNISESTANRLSKKIKEKISRVV